SMLHIVVIVHQHDQLYPRRYLLGELAQVWQDEGIRVTVQHGTEVIPDADLAILHVDMTVVPDEYLTCIRKYPKTVNAGVADISKRTISRHLVQRGDGYHGPVVVKTNRNYGGIVEATLAFAGLLPREYAIILSDLLPGTQSQSPSPLDYP